MPRVRTIVLATGAALLARRALRRRIRRSPLWPMPALDNPVSGTRAARSPAALRLLVTGRTAPADGVVELHLEALDTADLPAWAPGAHVDLVLPSGLVRQYSLCGDPADRGTYTLATRLVEDGRGGSREVHEQLHEGTEVEIRGPRNRFPLTDAPAYVFVAGGIGITPVLPMLRAAEAAGADWKLVYGGRCRSSMPYLDAIGKLAAPERVTIVAEDESGLPDVAAALAGAAEGTAVYCCGPEPLMAAVTEALPAGCTLHVERFAPGAPAVGGAFEVELRRTGRTVTVPADGTVLAAVRPEVPNVSYSCEQGFCGTCQQRVLEGDIDHRDELLTDAERDDSMLICVSRAYGERLVLDM
ncbi:PDR/VanB family oxidoreductase [Streptomyces chryseus]|uniref:Iron-sulfur protein n=2 Tax=Streptomyces chryseus TaxID=68186 RepID=A0ABQ3DG15_9ACTN|nr:PDR/VanB family oxidoreductase [Streptomyces chryseus]GHA85447.1 iron-sulfur protein [Streptomyces chryseus]